MIKKISILIFILFLSSGQLLVSAQDVLIQVPATNIFNRQELKLNLNTMSINNKNWRLNIIYPLYPTLKAVSGVQFQREGYPGASLPNSVLHWRLYTINGESPNTFNDNGAIWPGFKYFTFAEQYFFQPNHIINAHPRGNIALTYLIPASEFTNNAFLAGNYKMAVTHNYQYSFWETVEISPATWNTILSIPPAISWMSSNNSQYINISSLNEFRNAQPIVSIDLGTTNELAHTVDFKMWAKTSSSSIHFTSTKGFMSNIPLMPIQLSSSNPKIVPTILSANWKDLNSSNNNFTVVTGNRSLFPLKAGISQADFKTNFFRAGLYKFMIEFNAKDLNNAIASSQNMDITINVQPLSEIIIPTGGNIVNFQFNSITHYQNGQSKTIPNQIRISNNENYELFVKSDGAFFTKDGSQSDIPSNILQVGLAGSPLQVDLSPVPQKILQSNLPDLDRNLNMQYTITPASAQSLIAKDKNTFSINVIYSFTAL